jgi:hypothetical protein
MKSKQFIVERIAQLDKQLDINNPLKMTTRLFLWDQRLWWKDLLAKHYP